MRICILKHSISGNSVHLSLNVIIIIIAPVSILNEDEWEYLECLYKACYAAIADGGLFTDIMKLLFTMQKW